MESALAHLNRARREIIASREWEELLKEALLLVDDSAPILVQGSDRCVGNEPLCREVSKRLQHTQSYKELKRKTANFLAQNFTSWSCPEMQDEGHCFTGEDSATANMMYACMHLLQANASLKQQLKNALNHPLPDKLRRSAWKALLVQQPFSPADKQVTQQKLQKLGVLRLEREAVNKKLSSLLEATPTLTMLSKSFCAMGILKTVGFFWKQENNGLLTNSDLLLLAPFARVWSGHVNPQKTNCEMILFEVLEVFINFMKSLPPTMIVNMMENEVSHITVSTSETQMSECGQDLMQSFSLSLVTLTSM